MRWTDLISLLIEDHAYFVTECKSSLDPTSSYHNDVYGDVVSYIFAALARNVKSNKLIGEDQYEEISTSEKDHSFARLKAAFQKLSIKRLSDMRASEFKVDEEGILRQLEKEGGTKGSKPLEAYSIAAQKINDKIQELIKNGDHNVKEQLPYMSDTYNLIVFKNNLKYILDNDLLTSCKIQLEKICELKNNDLLKILIKDSNGVYKLNIECWLNTHAFAKLDADKNPIPLSDAEIDKIRNQANFIIKADKNELGPDNKISSTNIYIGLDKTQLDNNLFKTHGLITVYRKNGGKLENGLLLINTAQVDLNGLAWLGYATGTSLNSKIADAAFLTYCDQHLGEAYQLLGSVAFDTNFRLMQPSDHDIVKTMLETQTSGQKLTSGGKQINYHRSWFTRSVIQQMGTLASLTLQRVRSDDVFHGKFYRPMRGKASLNLKNFRDGAEFIITKDDFETNAYLDQKSEGRWKENFGTWLLLYEERFKLLEKSDAMKSYDIKEEEINVAKGYIPVDVFQMFERGIQGTKIEYSAASIRDFITSLEPKKLENGKWIQDEDWLQDNGFSSNPNNPNYYLRAFGRAQIYYEEDKNNPSKYKKDENGEPIIKKIVPNIPNSNAIKTEKDRLAAIPNYVVSNDKITDEDVVQKLYYERIFKLVKHDIIVKQEGSQFWDKRGVINSIESFYDNRDPKGVYTMDGNTLKQLRKNNEKMQKLLIHFFGFPGFIFIISGQLTYTHHQYKSTSFIKIDYLLHNNEEQSKLLRFFLEGAKFTMDKLISNSYVKGLQNRYDLGYDSQAVYFLSVLLFGSQTIKNPYFERAFSSQTTLLDGQNYDESNQFYTNMFSGLKKEYLHDDSYLAYTLVVLDRYLHAQRIKISPKRSEVVYDTYKGEGENALTFPDAMFLKGQEEFVNLVWKEVRYQFSQGSGESPNINTFTTADAEEMYIYTLFNKLSSQGEPKLTLYHSSALFSILHNLQRYSLESTSGNDYLLDFYRAINNNKHLQLSLGTQGFFDLRFTIRQLQNEMSDSQHSSQIMYAARFGSSSTQRPSISLSVLMDNIFLGKFLETYHRYHELFSFAKIIEEPNLGNLIVRLHKGSGQYGIPHLGVSRLEKSLNIIEDDEIIIDPSNKDSLRKGVFDLVVWMVQHPDGFFTAEFEKVPSIDEHGKVVPDPKYFLIGNIYGVFDETLLTSGMHVNLISDERAYWNRLGKSDPQLIWKAYSLQFVDDKGIDKTDEFNEKFEAFLLGYRAAFPHHRLIVENVKTFLPGEVPYLLGPYSEYIGDKRYKEIIEILAGEMRKKAKDWKNQKDENGNKLASMDLSIYYLGDKEIEITDLRQGKKVKLIRTTETDYKFK